MCSEEHAWQQRRIAELEEALRAPPLAGPRKPPPPGESFVQAMERTEAQYQKYIANIFYTRPRGMGFVARCMFMQWRSQAALTWREDHEDDYAKYVCPPCTPTRAQAHPIKVSTLR